MGRTTGSGQGSIYKRGDKWRGQITINGQRLSFTSKKKADVVDWMAKTRLNHAAGLLPKKSNITVQELCEYWLEHEKEPTIAPQTLNKMESNLRCHLYPVLGKYKVQDLTREIIEDAYPKMFSGDYSDGTIEGFASQFKLLLKYAIRQKIMVVNPHDEVIIRKRHNKKKVDAFTLEEQEKLIKYLKSQPVNTFNAMIYMLLCSGMRVGEAAALTVNDIDLETGGVKVTKTTVNIRGQISVQDHPKTTAGNRTIFLSKRSLAFLKEFIESRKESNLFVNSRGNLYSATTMQQRWIRTCAAAGIPYKGLHSLRHTFATRALEKGIDIKTVSSILGHKDVLTTMNLYQDVYSEHKIHVAEILNDLF